MMRHKNKLKTASFTVVLAALIGCTGKIHYPSYYVLNLRAPAPANAQQKPLLGPVAVRELRAPMFLRAGPIVYRQSPEQLNFYDFHRWAVDPRTAITNALVRNLETRGLFQSVHMYDGRGASDYLVTGMLEHLEEVDEGRSVTISVAMSAQLTSVKTGEVLWKDTSARSIQLKNRDVPAMVTQMSNAVEEAVDHLAASLQNRVALLSASLNRKETQQ